MMYEGEVEVWRDGIARWVVRDENGHFITWRKIEVVVPLKRYRASFDIRMDYPE